MFRPEDFTTYNQWNMDVAGVVGCGSRHVDVALILAIPDNRGAHFEVTWGALQVGTLPSEFAVATPVSRQQAGRSSWCI